MSCVFWLCGTPSFCARALWPIKIPSKCWRWSFGSEFTTVTNDDSPNGGPFPVIKSWTFPVVIRSKSSGCGNHRMVIIIIPRNFCIDNKPLWLLDLILESVHFNNFSESFLLKSRPPSWWIKINDRQLIDGVAKWNITFCNSVGLSCFFSPGNTRCNWGPFLLNYEDVRSYLCVSCGCFAKKNVPWIGNKAMIIIVIVLAHLVESLTHKIQLEFPPHFPFSGRWLGLVLPHFLQPRYCHWQCDWYFLAATLLRRLGIISWADQLLREVCEPQWGKGEVEFQI